MRITSHARVSLFSLHDLSDPLWRFKSAKDAREREKKREAAYSRRIVPCCFWRAKSLAVARWPQMWIKKPLTYLFLFLM